MSKRGREHELLVVLAERFRVNAELGEEALGVTFLSPEEPVLVEDGDGRRELGAVSCVFVDRVAKAAYRAYELGKGKGVSLEWHLAALIDATVLHELIHFCAPGYGDEAVDEAVFRLLAATKRLPKRRR